MMGLPLYPLVALFVLWVGVRLYRAYNRISIKELQGPTSGWLLGKYYLPFFGILC